jgi:hypothetical protein
VRETDGGPTKVDTSVPFGRKAVRRSALGGVKKQIESRMIIALASKLQQLITVGPSGTVAVMPVLLCWLEGGCQSPIETFEAGDMAMYPVTVLWVYVGVLREAC